VEVVVPMGMGRAFDLMCAQNSSSVPSTGSSMSNRVWRSMVCIIFTTSPQFASSAYRLYGSGKDSK
jgi:hypothetical protein